MRMKLGLGLGAGHTGPGVPPTPAAPVNTVAPSISGTAAVYETLTANPGSWTGYPSITFTYQWRRGGVNISGATASTYAAQVADYGTNLTVVVAGTNTQGNASGTSGAVAIGAAAPVNTVAPAISGSTSLGATLTATTGTWTGHPAPTYAYQWRRNGTNISGATASTYAIAVADSAATITCQVTATNAGGSAAQVSNGITAQTFTVPTITGAPSISGTATVGSTLTASAASVSGNPSPTRTWKWLRDGVDIAGATASTYLLVTADGDTDVSVEQIETNALGFDTAISSSVPVAGPPPSLYVDATYVAADYVVES